MKKKLISILMILILCFPSASALAASNVVDLETGLTTDMLSTYYVTTGNDDELERFASYEITIPSDTKQVVLPLIKREFL